MNRAVLTVVVANFLLIGVLPIVFFRRDGRLNLMWWLTGGPFFLCPFFLVGVFLGLVPAPVRLATILGPAQDLIALLPGLASIALIFFTLGTHRIPISLWHQPNDAPVHIVTYGAYSAIRHPFYASFILAFAGACVLLPHPFVLALLAYVAIVLNVTAAGEERRLGASEFGDEYRAYVLRTGRFFPRWSRRV